MAELAIFNASPLIALANAGYPQIVRAAADRLAVPAAVVTELAVRGESDPAVQVARSAAFEMMPDEVIPEVIAAARLGRGESAVLATGLSRRDALLILDDSAARRLAMRLGLTVCGTLWLLGEAKRSRIIPAVKPVVAELSRAGFFLPEHLVRAVLTAAGE